MKLWSLVRGLVGLVVMVAVGGMAAEEVTIWSWRSWDIPVWPKVEAALRAAGHDITIKFEVITPTEYDAKMSLALRTGTGPDLVYSRRLPGVRTASMIDAGLYLPIDDLVDLSYFPESVLKYITYTDGRVYGVPFAVQVIGIFYNNRYYEEFGLSEPQTWDELVANAEVLKSHGIVPFFIPGKEGWTLAMQHAMCGVSVLGPEWIRQLTDGEVNFLDPKFTDLNRRLNELKAYYQDGFLANSVTDMNAAFAFEQAAMVFYGIWEYKPTWKQLNPELEVGYFMVPPLTGDQTPYAYVYMDGAIALTSNAKNVDAALKVLRFCATPEFGTIFAHETWNIPAVSGASVPEDPLIQEILDVYHNHASPYVYWVGSVFVTQKPSLYDDVLVPGMQAMYAGKITPEELSRMAQDAISQWYPPLMKSEG